MGRLAGWLAAVLIVGSAASGCSASEGAIEPTPTRSVAPSPTPSAEPTIAGGGGSPNAECEPTEPVDSRLVPAVLRNVDELEQLWYGRDGLWVGAWFAADDVTLEPVDGVYGMKYPTVTLHEGEHTSRFGPPTVTTARLLGGSETVSAGFGGYASDGEFRFWPTGIGHLSPGCWEFTVAWHGTELEFVVEVP